MSPTPIVVKVGGSLLDLPGLGGRLVAWLDTLPQRRVLLVPGGGAAADIVRELDRCHGLGEEASHWLALRALSLTAHLLASVLAPHRPTRVVERLEDCLGAWREQIVPILDTLAFAQDDEDRPGCLPHSWSVTSDSVAARVAIVAAADELVLLKSLTIAPGMSWDEAGRKGFVDAAFAEVVASGLAVRAVNLREWQP
jgi:aspartokinase-like uncharacterized kinase